jgi:uncharacterized membrane protein YfcA
VGLDVLLSTPPGVSGPLAALLVGVSLFTSMLTAMLGLGGGMVLLAVMGAALPVTTLIPVHGVVQLGSNTGRAIVHARRLSWPLAGVFLAGSIFGALAGGRMLVTLPDGLLKALLGLFILSMIWGPKPRFITTSKLSFAIGGALASFATMFLGATGPLVSGLLGARNLDRIQLVGTAALCMTIQHGLKIIVFGLLGFAFAPWAGLIATMIISGAIGTLIGSHILINSREEQFKPAFRLVLTLLAANLVWQGLVAQFWI